MHLKRLIIAIIAVPLLYLYVMKLPANYSFFLITLIAAGGLYEFYSMFRLNAVMKYLGIIWGTGLMTAYFMSIGNMFSLYLMAALMFLGLRLFLKKDPAASMVDVSAVLLGLLYIPGLLSFQLNLVMRSPQWIILLYGSVWAADSMAYYVGKGIGRHKLYEAISPNKTMEGGAGSILGGMLGAGIIKFAIIPHLSAFQAIVLGFAIGASTIIGDLVESMLKRDAGVKDSSTILPGHGGILDKIDGVTFAGPVFYWTCLALGVFR
jgi:phosphatidate cytidylyltransferase